MKAQERRKQQLKQNIYRLSLVSFIVAMIWIGFEIYWGYEKTQEVVISSVGLEPLDEDLHVELAQKLLKREFIPPTELDTYLKTLDAARLVVEEDVEAVEESPQLDALDEEELFLDDEILSDDLESSDSASLEF